MGSSSTIPGSGQTTGSGLANAFMTNQPMAALPQTYSPIPTAPSPTFDALSKPGQLSGLTGSLIGNKGMPPLPQPTGPMPLPAPPVAAAPIQTPFTNPNLYYTGSNVQRGGMTTGGKPALTNGKPTPGVQLFKTSSHGR